MRAPGLAARRRLKQGPRHPKSTPTLRCPLAISVRAGGDLKVSRKTPSDFPSFVGLTGRQRGRKRILREKRSPIQGSRLQSVPWEPVLWPFSFFRAGTRQVSAAESKTWATAPKECSHIAMPTSIFQTQIQFVVGAFFISIWFVHFLCVCVWCVCGGGRKTKTNHARGLPPARKVRSPDLCKGPPKVPPAGDWGPIPGFQIPG